MMSIDLANAIDGSADNFSCLLFRLIMKADRINLEKLRSVWPVHVKCWELYRETGNILEDPEGD